MAAKTAVALDERLAAHRRSHPTLDGFVRPTQRRVAKEGDAAWMIATGDDLRMPTTTGAAATAATRMQHRYLDRVLAAATTDEEVLAAVMQAFSCSPRPRCSSARASWPDRCARGGRRPSPRLERAPSTRRSAEFGLLRSVRCVLSAAFGQDGSVWDTWTRPRLLTANGLAGGLAGCGVAVDVGDGQAGLCQVRRQSDEFPLAPLCLLGAAVAFLAAPAAIARRRQRWGYLALVALALVPVGLIGLVVVWPHRRSF